MGSQTINSFLLKNRRRMGDIQGIVARKRLKPVREAFYQQLWAKAAADTGSSMEALPGNGLQIRKNGQTITVDQSKVGLDGAAINARMSNKELILQTLAEKAIPVPKRYAFTIDGLWSAEKFLSEHAGNVVVKPAAGTGGGRGVTTGISSTEKLRRASFHAAGFHPNLLVEEELSGACYRLLYLDGQFLDAVRRDPPLVRGNGKDNIRVLIKAENKRRLASPPFIALSPLIIDNDCMNTLARQNLTLSTQPAIGKSVQVKTAVNENAAEQNHNVRTLVHPDIVAVGAELLIDLGVRFAGIDIMTDNIEAPLNKAQTYFNEINVDPGLHHHYLIAEPDQGLPIAKLLLEHVLNPMHSKLKNP